MDKTSMLKVLIGSSRIKYSVLDDLFKDHTIIDKKITMVIDGYALVRKLYQPDFYSDIDRLDSDVFIQEFVSSVLNTLAHYRRYFITRLHKKNQIYIVWNRTLPTYQDEILPWYGEAYFYKLNIANAETHALNKVLEKAIKFLKEMVQYFDGIYYLDTEGIADHAIVRLLMHEHPNDTFILYTKNEIWLQFCGTSHVLYLRPDRDKSLLIDSAGISEYLFRKQKYTPKFIKADNVRHLLAITGVKERDIEPVGGYRKTSIAKAIDKMVGEAAYISNMNIRLFVETLNDYLKKEYTSKETDKIEDNFRCIDAKLCLDALSKGKIKKVLQSRIDLYDESGLEDLNEMFVDADDVINISDLNLCTVEEQPTRWKDDELNVLWQED